MKIVLSSLSVLALIGVVMFSGCASNAGKGTVAKNGEIEREWVEQGITDNFIFARGIGAADQKMDNKTQRMATSRNASIVNAQYNMLSVIKGVKLEGGITVEKAMETDSILATSIDASIKGAQVVRSEWTADDGCVVVLRLSKKALKDMGLKMVQE
jgi:hypothetical protein